MTTALVTNIQRFSVHDGPGIRTTVFLKGCPLRCAWCHNPETMDPRPEVMLKDDRCLACDACGSVCGPGIAGPIEAGSTANRPDDRCERCGQCADVCPADARTHAGRRMDVNQVVAEAARDRTFYERSGGGVTFSGGEPLTAANAGFTIEALEGCVRSGLHAAVDTCGRVDRGALLAAARCADLVLFDVKLMDPARHRAVTGVDNGLILENLRVLSAEGACDVELRVPLIPGLNDDDANLDAVAALASSLPRRHAINVLPYHGIARDKYSRLGKTYGLADVREPDAAAVASAVERVRALGATVRIGG